MSRFVSRAAIAAHRGRDLLSGLRWTPNWCRAEANPEIRSPVADSRLFAILGSYNDEDVIEATVANAFTQGAERVYLVDNASTDETVPRALAAGAEVAEIYKTTAFEENLRVQLMNAAVWRISCKEPSAHIWWLWLDDDEFPHGPEGQTIKQYVDGLDRRFRIVGSTFYQHYPHQKPEYIRGFHPIDFQPFCEPFWQPSIPRCRQNHWKHPLQRFDQEGPFIAIGRGFHMCESADRSQLVEPVLGIVTHHFHYREEDSSRRRLSSSYEGVGGRLEHLPSAARDGSKRLKSVDAVYSQRWADVDNQRHVRGEVGVELHPWNEFTHHSEPKRWYNEQDLAQALEDISG